MKTNTRVIEFRDLKNLNKGASIDGVRSLNTLNLHQYGSADEMWTVWKENFTRICDKHAPKISRKVRNKSNPWINNELLHEKKHKNYLKQKVCKTSNLEDLENYKHARNNYNKPVKNRVGIKRGYGCG